jgi:Uncharacterised nucleotidyltransferase
MSPPSPEKDNLGSAIVSLRVDHVLGEVAAAFDAAVVGWLLLKGPSIRLRLYGEDTRDYRDLDLLVDPADEQRAYDALRSIGFTPREGYGPAEAIAEHHEWTRGADVAEVHVTIDGVRVPPRVLWDTLRGHRRALEVAGRTVVALDDAALALHLALHATKHGPAFAQGIEDLERGLSRLTPDAWREASRLAHELDAAAAFAAAMRLVPAELTAGVPLTGVPDAEALLRTQSANPVALGLARAMGDTPAARLRSVLRVIFPSRQFLRRWSYERGHEQPPHYVVAYTGRIGYLIRHAPAAAVVWRRAVKAARAEDPER